MASSITMNTKLVTKVTLKSLDDESFYSWWNVEDNMKLQFSDQGLIGDSFGSIVWGSL